MATKPQVIALEEHYLDPEVKRHFTGLDGRRCGRGSSSGSTISASCASSEMDEAGIDLQVLSHALPGCRRSTPRPGCGWRAAPTTGCTRPSRAHPDRFAAFAALPTADPKARGRRAGARRHQARLQGRDGQRPDQRRVSRRQAVLADLRARRGARRADLHAPLDAAPGGHRGLLQGLCRAISRILRAAWGFTVETATQGVRLVLSGVFDAYPGLKIILGHLGEGLPFYLWRISMGLARDGEAANSFRDIFCEHFWITTSGFFSDPALMCCMMEMGIDRILFSVDYPFVENPPGTEWAERLPSRPTTRTKILNGNAKRMLKM